MKLLYIIPIVLAILLFLGVRMLKEKYSGEKFIRSLQMIGLLFCALAVVAILMSFYISGDKTQLFKISFPMVIAIITIEQIRRNRKSDAK